MEATYIVLIFLFVVLYIQYRNKKIWLKQFIQKKKGKCEMLELAKRFIGRECIIYTFNSQLTGLIKEVTDGAILIENGGAPEAVNIDFVVRIREYPKKKNGKKKSVILD